MIGARERCGIVFVLWNFTTAQQPAQVCPNLAPFYRIKSLLPAVRRRKQGPSDFWLTSFL